MSHQMEIIIVKTENDSQNQPGCWKTEGWRCVLKSAEGKKRFEFVFFVSFSV